MRRSNPLVAIRTDSAARNIALDSQHSLGGVMPIKLTVKNRDEDSIVVYRYFGLVVPDEVVAALKDAFGKLTPGLP